MMSQRCRVILQARSNSNRLPGKVLMPLCGIPLAVFCAKRLSSLGHDVVLATSIAESDDALCKIAGESNVTVFRGSLANVYERFLNATADMGDTDIIVRATADNPIPDGYFVNELLEIFYLSGLCYLGTNSPDDGLPYGVSAEIFTVGNLRAQSSSRMSAEEREHVTTKLRAKAGLAGMVKNGALSRQDISELRLTIDTASDFKLVSNTLDALADPLSRHWRELVGHFVAKRYGSESHLCDWSL